MKKKSEDIEGMVASRACNANDAGSSKSKQTWNSERFFG
jgi:hypothetical protein